MIKKIKSTLFFSSLLFCLLTGCVAKNEKAAFWESNGKLKILSTTAMINDLAKEIGGEEVDALTLIVGEMDPHTYELVKGDEEKFSQADLILYNGLHLECGYSLRQHLEGNNKAIALGNTLLESKKSSLITYRDQFDPHIWLDMELFSNLVDPIVSALVSKDPLHENIYRERGKKLKEEMERKDKEIKALLQNIPEEKRYLITSHSAFGYFAKHYLATDEEIQNNCWQGRAKAPQGLAPEAEISIADLEAIVEHIKAKKISVVFFESNVNRDSLKRILTLTKKMGLDVRLARFPLYGDAMKEKSSYIESMWENAQTIARELELGNERGTDMRGEQ